MFSDILEEAQDSEKSQAEVQDLDDDIEVEAVSDPDVIQRISLVETQLIEMFDHLAALSDTDRAPRLPKIKIPKELAIHQPHAYPCTDTFKRLPAPPFRWPQAPVMLRPTPGSDMKIRGIRYADSTKYQSFAGFCAGCILPINTGQEKPGKSLVVDFESPHFVGTLLMRIKDIPQVNDSENYDQSTCYFEGKKRKFQAVVKGKFKTPLRMSECVTGQAFERPAGQLPHRLIVNTFIKIVSTLAPQLEATLEGNHPRFLTPLVATAQTVQCKDSTQEAVHVPAEVIPNEQVEQLLNYHVYAGSTDMEDYIEEPSASDMASLLQTLEKNVSDDKSSAVSTRMKARKRAFNHIAAKHAPEPVFDLQKEYTFEFYQHLLLFTEDELQVELGRAIGNIGLAQPLNGQPIKFMGAHKHPETSELSSLWSFELWHESLYGSAQQALDHNYSQRSMK